MKNKNQIQPNNPFYWSWRRFSENVLELNSKKEQSAHSVVLSVAAAFLIVVFSAQILGWVNNMVEKQYLLEKYQNANVLVYSNIG